MLDETKRDRTREIWIKIRALVDELEVLWPGRKFTPDGHLTGSMCEVLAAADFGLQLHGNSTPVHDALCKSGRNVQIKGTQGSSIAISDCCDYLIAVKLRPDGTFEICYNGAGQLAWNAAGKPSKTGQRRISLSTLRRLNSTVADCDRIVCIPPDEPGAPD